MAFVRPERLERNMFGYRPLQRTLEACLRDLASQSADVRRSAVSDLVHHARSAEPVRSQAIAKIASALSDPAPPVRSTAALALAEVAAREAVPELCRALSDQDAYVREMAMTALGEIADAQALPKVTEAFATGGPELRYQAVIAYARLQKDDVAAATRFISEALRDDEPKVRYIALRVAEESSLALTNAEPCLSDAAPMVRLAAAIYLGKHAPVQSVCRAKARAMVQEVVRSGTLQGAAVPKEDEAEAVELMGAWNCTGALADLEKRAFGLRRLLRNTCIFHAKIALARLGHAKAAREILEGLQSASASTRASSVVAAGRARMQGAKPRLQALRNDAAIGEQLVEEALALLAAPSESTP
jgi:HEAT repeats